MPRIDDNLPDDWNRMRERCPHCGGTFHPAEGCDCEPCAGCGDSTPPDRLDGDGRCAGCAGDDETAGPARAWA